MKESLERIKSTVKEFKNRQIKTGIQENEIDVFRQQHS